MYPCVLLHQNYVFKEYYDAGCIFFHELLFELSGCLCISRPKQSFDMNSAVRYVNSHNLPEVNLFSGIACSILSVSGVKLRSGPATNASCVCGEGIILK